MDDELMRSIYHICWLKNVRTFERLDYTKVLRAALHWRDVNGMSPVLSLGSIQRYCKCEGTVGYEDGPARWFKQFMYDMVKFDLDQNMQ